MFLPGLGRRAVKIIKMLAWDAHKLNRQVMYFKDIHNIGNTLIDILESITYLLYHLKHELVTLSFS